MSDASKDNNNKELAYAFWTKYYKEDYDSPIAWASEKAYLDLSRTLTFREKSTKDNEDNIKKDRKNWRDEVAVVINSQINDWRKSDNFDFDKWHEDTCNLIIEKYDKDKNGLPILVKRNPREEASRLTLGHAQKWLNMTLKYLWLLNEDDIIDGNLKNFINKNIENFHVPLDSYILKYVNKYGKKIKGTKFEPNNGLGGKYEIAKHEEYKEYKWSLISSYNDYINFQKKIKEDLDMKGTFPLKWELEHWHKAVMFYESTTRDEILKYGTECN